MLADLPKVTSQLREGTFAATLARLREDIRRQLRATGSYTIREGTQEFTITVPAQATHRPGVAGQSSK